MSPSTTERRSTIRDLLETHEVPSQAELLDLLAAHGVQTTQPVLSRDLRALHVAKRDGAYRLSERVTPLDSLALLLRDAQTAGPNLVVVKCEPGAASAVARALEAEELEGLVGTVAGDDSLFAAVEAKAHGESIKERILALVE